VELGFEAMESRGRCWLWLPCLEGMESLWVEWEAERWTLLVGKEEREGRRELVPPLEFEFVFVRRGSTVAIVSSWRWSCIGRNWVRESSLVAAIDRASFLPSPWYGYVQCSRYALMSLVLSRGVSLACETA